MAFVGRSDVKDPGAQQEHWDRIARRRERLRAEDPQFSAAKPDDTVAGAARRPGLRIAQVMATVMEGHADRPALSARARELETDPATGADFRCAASTITSSGWRGSRQRCRRCPKGPSSSRCSRCSTYRHPAPATPGSPVPAAGFRAAVKSDGREIPSISRDLITKYVDDMRLLGML
jgi:hypothetical protein